jgi:hypothetical protein
VSRRRRTVAAVVAVLAIGSLSACSSQPGNRRVVSDVIESLQLPDDEEACMLERLEGYSDEELEQIEEDNETWSPSDGSTMAEASEGMRLFIDDFAECTGEDVAAETSEPPATTTS